MSEQLLLAEGLRKSFPAGRGLLGRARGMQHAVRGVDVSLDRGETLAVVGESGAGKSTLGRMLLRLVEPDAGTLRLAGIDLLALGRRELRATRRRMQMVFQDPYSSFDPRMPVGDSVGHPLTLHLGLHGAARRARVLELLERVGIDADQAQRRPDEFSGGQLQRIAVARALAVEPDLVVCDEPVAALDVSVRAQVVNLLAELQRERGVSYVLVSHDLSLVRAIAHRVAIMRDGEVVEQGPAAAVFADPHHPYTKSLLDAVPIPDPRRRPVRGRSDANPKEETAGCNSKPEPRR
jgi:ABC-type glutathione transport system ATPase component